MRFFFKLILGVFLWAGGAVANPLSVADLEFVAGLSVQKHRFGINSQSVVGIPAFIQELNARLSEQNPVLMNAQLLLPIDFIQDSIVSPDDGLTCSILTFLKLAEGLGGATAPQPWVYQPPTSGPLSIRELEAIGSYTAAQWKAAKSNNAFTIGASNPNGADFFLNSFAIALTQSMPSVGAIRLYFDTANLDQTATDTYYASTLPQIIKSLNSGMVTIVPTVPPLIIA